MNRRALVPVLGLLACAGLAACDAPREGAGDPAEWERLAALGYVESAPAERSARGVVAHDPARAWPGWNLYSSRTAAKAWLVDMAGNEVHAWQGEADGPGWNHVVWAGDGGLFVLSQRPSLLRLDAASRVLWERPLAVHHDLVIDEEGRLHTLERVAVAQPDGSPLLGENVLVLDAEGAVLRRVPIHPAVADRITPEHRAATAASAPDPRSVWQRLRSGFAPLPLDVLHANSIARLDRDVAGLGRRGDWLVSLRNLDRVVVISAESGELVTEIGAGRFARQHHASVLPNGHVLVFDNGRDRASRAVEVDPRSGAVAWEYTGPPGQPLRSRSQGGAQRLANGNTLVVESDRGRVVEVTPAGTIVWEFLNPLGDLERGTRASIYRMTRLPPGAFTPR